MQITRVVSVPLISKSLRRYRLKCDERRPTCQQCEDTKRVCKFRHVEPPLAVDSTEASEEAPDGVKITYQGEGVESGLVSITPCLISDALLIFSQRITDTEPRSLKRGRQKEGDVKISSSTCSEILKDDNSVSPSIASRAALQLNKVGSRIPSNDGGSLAAFPPLELKQNAHSQHDLTAEKSVQSSASQTLKPTSSTPPGKTHQTDTFNHILEWSGKLPVPIQVVRPVDVAKRNHLADRLSTHPLSSSPVMGLREENQEEQSSLRKEWGPPSAKALATHKQPQFIPQQRFNHQLQLGEDRLQKSLPGIALPPQHNYQPPAVTFIVNGSIESSLPKATMESLLTMFATNCHVFLKPRRTPIKDVVYIVDVFLWQQLPAFYEWFMRETRSTEAATLKFELFNANHTLEHVFTVSVNDSCHFHKLKQRIWDWFWVASAMHSSPVIFKVLISSDSYLDGQLLHYGNSMDVATQTALHPKDTLQLRNLTRQHAVATPLRTPEILLRLQMNGAGKLSDVYGKWALGPSVKVAEFFAWFASQTGRGGDEGPPSLTFTLKDAAPCPMSSTMTQSNDDLFSSMKRDLLSQLDKTRSYVPNLNEFVVLVTDPGWGLAEADW